MATNSRPILQPIINKAAGVPQFVVDVHTHFFNASDLTVKGFLEGPVAFSRPGIIGDLARALAPFADELAKIAPTAADEFRRLQDISILPEVLNYVTRSKVLQELIVNHRRGVSHKFYDLVHGSEFERIYDKIQDQRLAASGRERGIANVEHLQPESVANAMVRGNRVQAIRGNPARFDAQQPYPDGLLAFVGVMLMDRWHNLNEFGQAYSESSGAFGVDMALAALVDFDHWLDNPPLSPHEDQIKLHQLMSRLSGGYMRPLVAYNPASHIKEGQEYLDRVQEAVDDRGFVGVKIYPPNGFRPFGNAKDPLNVSGPTGSDLDGALKKFWDTFAATKVTVMAHTGETFGSDAAHEDGADPKGWQYLLDQASTVQPPKINLGHLGGDETKNSWTEMFAAQMESPGGSAMYGDLSYWSSLRCCYVEQDVCNAAKHRLGSALSHHPAFAKRVMYGSDWHMLVQEPDWAQYPFDIAAATRDSVPLLSQDDLFGQNAKRCFDEKIT